MVRALKTAAMVLLLALGTVRADNGFTTLLDDAATKGVDRTELFREDFNQAMKLLEQGQFDQARLIIEKVIARNPGSSVALKLRDSIKSQVLLKAFMEAPQPTLDAIKSFLAIAEEGRREWLRDSERISKLVNDVVAGEFDAMWLAIHELNRAGQHAVPQLVGLLSGQDGDVRSKVAMALIAIGSSGIPALSEALQIEDNLVKHELIFILGEVGDRMALPALAELARVSDQASIRESASRAVARLAGEKGIKSSQEYYLDLANRFFSKDISVILQPSDDFLIWSWDAESQKLAYREVPEYSYYLEMAEVSCYKALGVDLSFQRTYPLLLNIYFQQVQTNQALLDAIDAGLGKVSPAEKAAIIARKERAEDILRSARSFGKMNYYNALARAMADKNTGVAVSIIDTLALLGNTQDLPVVVDPKRRREAPPTAAADALVAALDADTKFVRYHAAAALAGMADRQFPGIEKVVPLLSQALGERGANVVMVADANVQILNQLRSELGEQGYIVDTASDPASAVNVGFAVPMKDVLVIDADFSSAIDAFIGDFRTRQVPVIVLTNEDNAHRAEARYEGKVSAFLSKPVGQAELEATVRAAIQAQRRSTAKDVALRLNYMAARTLANMNVHNTALSMSDALPALVRTLELPDVVRLEALKALANVASPDTQNELASVAANTANSLQARLGALEALAAIAVKHGGVQSNVADTARNLLNDAEADVREAAGTVIGAATLRGVTAAVEGLMADGRWVVEE